MPGIRIVYFSLLLLAVAILLGSALFMAFKTRKIQIKDLNDAKFITAIVYVTSLSLLIYAIVRFILEKRVNTYPAVAMAVTLISATIVQGLVYIPKV